jgi:hypothetical protein
MKTHFEFKDWKEAFQTYYKEVEKDPSLQLILSTHPYSSGYWIEQGQLEDRYSYIYSGMREAKKLEQRIKRAIYRERIATIHGTYENPLALSQLVI